MSDFEHLRLEHRGATAIITLHRPDDANALHLPLARELAQAALACDRDPHVRAVVLTGTGRFFCAGGDVKSMATFGDRIGHEVKALADEFHRAIATLSRMRPPLIVCVNGTAAGAGVSLAVIGDLVIAADQATFTLAYTSIGLSPDGSSTWFLPRLIGLRRTQELMFTNRRLTAAEAQDWGLVTKAAPAAACMGEALAWAEQFGRGSPDANGGVKRLLQSTWANGLETQMELEGRCIADCAAGDGREGIAAFTQKRLPRFDAL